MTADEERESRLDAPELPPCRCGHDWEDHRTMDDGQTYESRPCCQVAEECYCLNYEPMSALDLYEQLWPEEI